MYVTRTVSTIRIQLLFFQCFILGFRNKILEWNDQAFCVTDTFHNFFVHFCKYMFEVNNKKKHSKK